MLKGHGCLAAAATLAVAQMAFGQVNGQLDSGEYGPAIAVQTVPTGFGDNQNELNAAYGVLQSNGSFKVLLTGNMEGNGNGFVIFLDARAGGAVASTLPDGSGLLGSFGGRYTDDWGNDTDGGAGTSPTPGGPSILDPGFNPETSWELNVFQQPTEPKTNYYINIIDMTLPNEDLPNRDVYLGTNFLQDPSVTQTYLRDGGATNAGDITHAFNNTNTLGVNGYDFGTPPGPLGDPLTATTGFEAEYSAFFLNATPLQPLRLLPFITNGGGDFLANQFLPGLPGGPENLGNPGGLGGTPLFDASTFAGNQYIEIGLPTYTGGNANYSAAVFSSPTPNGVNTSAVFGAGTGGTVTLDVPVTLGGLRFSGTNAYTVAGSSTLTLDTFGATARVDVTGGSHTVSAPVVVNKNVELSASTGATVSLSNVSYASGVNVSKTGPGRVNVNNVRAAGLAVSGGAMGLTSGTSKVNTLTVDTGATLDIGPTGVAVDYTGASPLATIESAILSGRAGGAWTGTGITSSNAAANSAVTGIGFAEAGDLGLTSFGGQTVDADTVVFGYTRLGDANLSGVTDIGDFSILAANFNSAGKWSKGDFNYDQSVDIGDFSILAANFNQSAPASLPRGAAVPEPTALGLIGLAALGLARRVRRA